MQALCVGSSRLPKQTSLTSDFREPHTQTISCCRTESSVSMSWPHSTVGFIVQCQRWYLCRLRERKTCGQNSTETMVLGFLLLTIK